MGSLADSPLTVRSGRVKAARKLTRRAFRTETGLFLAEGRQAVREALAVPGCVREVFVSGEAHDDLRAEFARNSNSFGSASDSVSWMLAEPAALATLSDTVSPQGIVAVCCQQAVPLTAALAASARLAVLCAEIRDPGNAGTIVRSADGAGADLVVFGGAAVDAYNPKAVRASVGSIFHVPHAAASTDSAIATFKDAGHVILAADGAGEQDLFELLGLARPGRPGGDQPATSPSGAGRPESSDWAASAPLTWVFGNEAKGLSPEMLALADYRVRIPIYGRAESLNLATAAAVCLYTTRLARSGSSF